MTDFNTRADYDAYVATWPKDQQWQWWPVPWRFATCWERFVKIALWLLGAVAVIVMFLALMALIATIVDNAADRSIEHERCMKQATNGHEIEQCR